MNIKNKSLYDEMRKLSGYSLDSETSCLRVSGDDASKFLQGQLSNDINLIDDNNDEQFLSLGLGYNFLDRPSDTQMNLSLYQTQNSTNTMNSSLISFSYRKKY